MSDTDPPIHYPLTQAIYTWLTEKGLPPTDYYSPTNPDGAWPEQLMIHIGNHEIVLYISELHGIAIELYGPGEDDHTELVVATSIGNDFENPHYFKRLAKELKTIIKAVKSEEWWQQVATYMTSPAGRVCGHWESHAEY